MELRREEENDKRRRKGEKKGVGKGLSVCGNCQIVVNRKSQTMPPPKEITYKSVHNGYYALITLHKNMYFFCDLE